MSEMVGWCWFLLGSSVTVDEHNSEERDRDAILVWKSMLQKIMIYTRIVARMSGMWKLARSDGSVGGRPRCSWICHDT